MDRYDYERAVEASTLDSACRALACALARRLNRETGAIPEHAQPSLRKLARLTGLGVSTVKRHLTELAAQGWVLRDSPPLWLAQARHVTTAYTPTIPPGFPQARPRPGRALGPARPQPRPAPAREHGPGRPARHGPGRPTETTGEDNPDREQQPDDALVRVAQDELSALLRQPVRSEHAAEAARQILAGRTVPRPAAYLRAALRADPRRWVPRPGAPSDRTAAEAVAEALAR